MQIAEQYNLAETVNDKFYICKDNDASKVLYSTMGGDQFIDINSREREWQSPMVYNTLEEATEQLDILYANKKEVTLKYNLQILKIRTVTNVQHSFFETFISHQQHEENRRLSMMKAFEEFYAGASTTICTSELQNLRSTDKAGYKDEKVNDAFNRYIELVGLIPA